MDTISIDVEARRGIGEALDAKCRATAKELWGSRTQDHRAATRPTEIELLGVADRYDAEENTNCACQMQRSLDDATHDELHALRGYRDIDNRRLDTAHRSLGGG
ncbi:hypothetical protein GCM10010994_24000 [Chelatococcus reniformis]|uniref:Uncharacterized protein n=1 Tax=Chelatococcus reniformis TaxID=1494448 RepID=A0A916XD08_9HYPH|nr:hypothetical protein GCM10010994_24000 [Chelatococcus reniformis]